jgi:hypothetical protein
MQISSQAIGKHGEVDALRLADFLQLCLTTAKLRKSWNRGVPLDVAGGMSASLGQSSMQKLT